MYYVYVVKREKDRFYYIGATKDLKKRVARHSTGQKGTLIYHEAYSNGHSALMRELQLKQYGGSWRSLKKRLQI